MKELLRATWVIARRDFTAVVMSRAFIFFLVAPLLFAGLYGAAKALESHDAPTRVSPVVGVQLGQAEAARLIAAAAGLRERLGDDVVPRLEVAACRGRPAIPPAAMLRCGGYQALLTGSLARPVLTAAPDDADRWQGPVGVAIDAARRGGIAAAPALAVHLVAPPPERPDPRARGDTAQALQGALFVMIVMLGGRLLSNLVEEKASKVIEILAASIPIDAVFLGKLLAMLASALVAIAVWGGIGAALQPLFGVAPVVLAAPAIGWPLFIALTMVYFAMAYLLLGALLLGIGSLASTVREVQTLSMPVTMGQLAIFFLASYVVHRIGQPIEIAAALIPFSSPFAMLSRAAQQPDLWPHLLAILWQAAWVLVIVRIGSALFRRNVLKSGGGKRRG